MTEKKKKGPEAVVREIKRQTRRKFTSEGKIGQYHRTMKNIIKLEHYYSPEDLEANIAFGRDQEVLARRDIIKQRTLTNP